MTSVRYLGAYAVPVAEAERLAALACQGNPDYVAQELGSLALVEIEVSGALPTFDVGTFKQPHTDYVPYDESYFDPKSLTEIEHEPFKPPSHVTDFRIAFFLHFFDPNQPLQTPYGDVVVGPLSERPAHLANKQYEYWE